MDTTPRNSSDAREGRRRTAVMADVAKLAGVSHQTVSRVVNDSAQVRPETRRRVLAAMRELDYRPNPAARALVTGRSRTLGVVSFDTTLYGPASTLFAIEQAAHAADYFITIVSLPALDRVSVRNAIERLRVQGVDGILVIIRAGGRGRGARRPPGGDPRRRGRGRPGGRDPGRRRRPVRRGGERHALLLDLGHRTVHHLAGPRDCVEAQQRVEGWRSTLAAAGGSRRRSCTATGARGRATSSGGGWPRTRTSPPSSSPTTRWRSACCGPCTSAAGRPGDVSIVGFDDIPEAQYFTPPLTTVRQDFGEMGRSALRLMLDVMEETIDPAARLTVAPELVVRRSTGPPPA